MTELLAMFHAMLRIRMVEERIADAYGAQEMRCPVHLCIGQEAVPAGVSAALRDTDYAMSGHRCHGHYLAKGGDLKAMIAEFYGKETGCASGKGGSMHLVDLDCGFLGAAPIVASTIPIAVGAAFAAAMRGEDRITVVYFGEGATESGVFHESVNFAVLHALPVLFVCENNLYSVYSPLSVRQPTGREVYAVARGLGVASTQADGNDVEAVHAAAVEAVARARSGRGPGFLEFPTYRWREHCGPLYDNDIGYRSEAEFETWKAGCPVRRAQSAVLERRLATAKGLAALRAEIDAEIDAAFAFAKSSRFPKAVAAYDGLYAI